jgi:hypothetical protein
MPRVEFEPTTPVFEQAKTVHALDRATTVSGTEFNNFTITKGSSQGGWDGQGM